MDIKNIAHHERLITGLVLAAVAIFIVWLDWAFVTWTVIGAIAAAALYETVKILKIEDSVMVYIYAAAAWILAYFCPYPQIIVFGLLVLAISSMVFKNSMDYKSIFPLLYPLAPMLFVLSLSHDFGMKYLVWLVFIVCATDTAAFYAGKAIGSMPFSPVSPKKTWEGVYSGVTAGVIFGVIVGIIIDVGFLASLFISILVSVSSIFGDLFESYLKRGAGVKDSGNILPGHGGILDRADGYLFGAVVMVVLLNLFNIGVPFEIDADTAATIQIIEDALKNLK
ncbi:MAG: phosphatidate cytidylyltransferase [Campylobacteraceae bacterium]|jgi:phosphatidate cytidylyltransferase|nr:phosphatidate cytidylyltransferase [Campylobacteraceae bacterium]